MEPIAPENLEAPPNCGKRFLPTVVDEIASTDPNRVFASLPRSSNLVDGFKDVNYRTYANAVNRCAHWLKDQLKEYSEPQVVLYLGPLDLRYLIIIVAAAKAGHIAFYSSHRNSLEAHLSLIERSGCTVVLLPENPPLIIKQILDVNPLKTVQTPNVAYFMNEEQVEPIPFHMVWEKDKNKPFCVLHTSGSTGIPKPVFVTYGTFACNDAHQLIPSLGGKPTLINFLKGKRYFLGLPLFHAASLTFTLGFNVFSGVTCVLPPPGPLTADVANQAILHGNLDGALFAPSLVVDCFNNEEYCSNMVKNLQFVSYVGGSLPEEVGNPLSKRIKLLTLMGSCETALHPLELNDDPSDWQYLTISPHLGHIFRPERDGLYDLVVVRQPNLAQFQGVFSTFPNKKEFAMGDLFEPHPKRPESWVFKARADDIIAFTTAEKLNPITMESVISANPLVKSALIGGQGQFQASLLIEPRVYPTSLAEKEELMKNIWPSILQANRDCPAHGRIMKGFVMLTKADRPLPRAGKDTVQRHAALKLYAEDFKELYNQQKLVNGAPAKAANTQTADTSASSVNTKGISVEELLQNLDSIIGASVEKHLQAALAKILSNLLGNNTATETINQSSQPVQHAPASDTHTIQNDIPVHTHVANPSKELRQLIYDTLAENLPIEDINDESDLFQCGLDSLQVPGLLSTINSFLIKSRPNVALIDSKVVYDNPSVGGLLKVLS